MADDALKQIIDKAVARGLGDDDIRLLVAEHKRRQTSGPSTTPSPKSGYSAVDASAFELAAMQGMGQAAEQVGGAYVEHGPRTVRRGLSDIGQGNLARGARQVLSGTAVTAAPMLAPAAIPAIVAAPGATALALGAGMAAHPVIQATGEAAGLTPDQAGLAADIGSIGVGGGVVKGVSAIPTTAKAGAKFQQVARAAGNQTVNTSGAVGDSALRIAELGERGGTMPKVARQFLNRITDPSKGDLTYTEARDFYSNISRLSAADAMKTSPAIHREMGNLRAALDKAVESAAAKGGQAENYRQAMRQYAIASRIKSIASKIGQHAGKGAAGAVGVGAGYSAWKALSD